MADEDGDRGWGDRARGAFNGLRTTVEALPLLTPLGAPAPLQQAPLLDAPPTQAIVESLKGSEEYAPRSLSDQFSHVYEEQTLDQSKEALDAAIGTDDEATASAGPPDVEDEAPDISGDTGEATDLEAQLAEAPPDLTPELAGAASPDISPALAEAPPDIAAEFAGVNAPDMDAGIGDAGVGDSAGPMGW